MIYYFLVFSGIVILSFGLILSRRTFFSFAYSTSILLNIMLENEMEEAKKRKIHLKALGEMTFRFLILLIILGLIILLSFLPIIIYGKVTSTDLSLLDRSSIYFIGSLIFGSFPFFVFPRKKQNEDYSEWSKIMHKMILDNYNISKSLFKYEKKRYKKVINQESKDFVIVSGLARGGTTALTNLLYSTGSFYSLSYNNMPFILSVNTWRKLYNPKKNRLKERAHGDNLLFGYNTIEALEEYFFKAFLKDRFINEDKLIMHEINQEIYHEYENYQKLIKARNPEKIYLAKNNNMILRYESMRDYNPDFKLLLIFRKPEQHAYSLRTQHNRFSKKQADDHFVIDYMNWLGHHEFGLNHKYFELEKNGNTRNFEKDSINYWLSIWIEYYNYILSIVGDKNLFLIDYFDLCHNPNELLLTIKKIANIDLNFKQKDPYKERKLPELDYSSELLERATILYSKLKKHKIKLIYNT